MKPDDVGDSTSLDHWRLCDELSVTQAALLIAGVDPDSELGATCELLPVAERPRGYMATLEALKNAINAGRLAATVRYEAREYGWAEIYNDVMAQDLAGLAGLAAGERTDRPDDEVLAPDHSCTYKPFPSWALTTVMVDDLIKWLAGRGVKTGFFFPNQPADQVQPYLDPEHPRYARKLAAAVNAWLAVTNPGNRSPKQALEKWLRENAAQFELTDEDGNPVKNAIESCATVSNWSDVGGAPRAGGNERS